LNQAKAAFSFQISAFQLLILPRRFCNQGTAFALCAFALIPFCPHPAFEPRQRIRAIRVIRGKSHAATSAAPHFLTQKNATRRFQT
jgi:hypothetical protein